MKVTIYRMSNIRSNADVSKGNITGRVIEDLLNNIKSRELIFDKLTFIRLVDMIGCSFTTGMTGQMFDIQGDTNFMKNPPHRFARKTTGIVFARWSWDSLAVLRNRFGLLFLRRE